MRTKHLLESETLICGNCSHLVRAGVTRFYCYLNKDEHRRYTKMRNKRTLACDKYEEKEDKSVKYAKK